MLRTGATLADAAAEWLRYVEHDRAVKPSTMVDYRPVAAQLVEAFGSLRVEELTARASRSGEQALTKAVTGHSRTGLGTRC